MRISESRVEFYGGPREQRSGSSKLICAASVWNLCDLRRICVGSARKFTQMSFAKTSRQILDVPEQLLGQPARECRPFVRMTFPWDFLGN